MNLEFELIAAESTPLGRGGISIVRLSGKGARAAVAQLFDREMPELGRHRFGVLRVPEHAPIDEVVMIAYAAPHSYTGEDMVEISLHGSPVVVAEALDALYSIGVRPAKPGEFTLRAFLNGRIDLTQAEAVADLIAARSRQSADQAKRQMQGGISRAANETSDLVARLLALCELELDFVDEDVELAGLDEKSALVNQAREATAKMLAGYRHSRRLREGVRVAITGAPNVGKSSLFNALLGEDRAIVHRTPGTTRDAIQATCIINGIACELFDTAGIRAGAEEIEDEGIRRAINIAESADIRVIVAAADQKLADEFSGDMPNAIKIVNKVDLASEPASGGVISVSALTGQGLDGLKRAIFEMATGGDAPSESSVSRERHFRTVTRADEALQRAGKSLVEGYPPEMIAEELREALSALDELTGKRRLENLLDEIFSQFCIGK